MINTVTESVAFDFLVDGKRAMLGIVVKGHLWGVVAGFAVDKITDSGVFYNHLGPEGVARKTEEI